jgi:hypothetical protein
MGGMTAQALAAKYPQLLKSITIANAAMHYDEAARAMWAARVKTVLEQGVAAIADGALQRWFTPEFRADETGGGKQRVAALREQLEKTDAAAYAASCEAVANIDFRASNGGIQCPALVIAGTRDEATPVAMSEAIRKSIPGAQLQHLAGRAPERGGAARRLCRLAGAVFRRRALTCPQAGNAVVLGIAVAGAGVIGRRHVELIQASARTRLCAVVDPQPASRDFAAGLGVPHF